jgi:hypothetical protein
MMLPWELYNQGIYRPFRDSDAGRTGQSGPDRAAGYRHCSILSHAPELTQAYFS